ncbi:MAG: ChaB family protein [Propionibacteriaceae bacterium]|nr:ChaB family protein [Propionibacteriaceae bacterium]
MPKTNKDGSAKKSELPSTLERSPDKAQRTYAHTYDAAVEQYDGDEERAQRTAWSAVKHTHEKVGDHWEAKDSPGPSDERAEQGGPSGGESAGGVDANATKEHLLDLARRLDVTGRSRMTKAELVEALQKANDKATREASE